MPQMKQKASRMQENGITEGVIWKQLLLFFFPILLGTFFQQLYNTVMTPSEVTFSIASAIRRPISGSPAEMVPTRAISLLSFTFWL